MPELPEVETVRRGLMPSIEGRRILKVTVGRPDLRFPFPVGFADRLAGRRLVALGRRAKYLIGDLDDGTVLIMHLGMSGSFRLGGGPEALGGEAFHHPRGKDGAHDHVRFHFEDGIEVVYNDPRRFGFMTLAERASLDVHPLLQHLGPEPTGNALSAEALAAVLAGRRSSLKAALLDQSVIAGLGNIYVCESLHRAGLSPFREAGSVVTAKGAPSAGLVRLTAAIREVIGEAIEAGGSTLRDHRLTDGSLGYFQHRFAVYDRAGDPCPRVTCDGVVERAVQTGRATFHCPRCQR